uniref:Uncharacterized protein n=1 Tax=Macrostomum lignano TaxID=282301 RepID=A0A1I8FG71_9PLAT
MLTAEAISCCYTCTTRCDRKTVYPGLAIRSCLPLVAVRPRTPFGNVPYWPATETCATPGERLRASLLAAAAASSCRSGRHQLQAVGAADLT